MLSAHFPFFAGILFVLSLSVVAWYVCFWWLRSKHHFFFVCYLFIFLAGSVIYLATINLDRGGFIGLIGTLINLALISHLAKRIKLPAKNLRWLGIFGVLSLLIIIVPMAGYSSYRRHSQAANLSGAKRDLQAQKTALDDKAHLLEQVVNNLGTNADLISAAKRGKGSLVINSLQDSLRLNNLQYLTLTDASGSVLMRAQNPASLGDTLPERLPWSANLLRGQAVSGLGFDEIGYPTVFAAIPIKDKDTLVGSLVAGFYLDKPYLRSQAELSHEGSGIANERGLIEGYSNKKLQQAVFNSEDFNQKLRSSMANGSESFSFEVGSGTSYFLATGERVPTLVDDRFVTILSLRDEPTP